MSSLVLAIALVGLVAPAERVDSARSVEMIVLLQTGTDEERIRAARWLGLHGAPEAASELRLLYQSIPVGGEREEIRLVAELMYQLASNPDLLQFRSRGEVVAALGDPDPDRRIAAVRHVAYLDLRAELPRVIEMLDESHPYVRAAAIEVLRYLDLEARYAGEVAMMLQDPADVVRNRALRYFFPRGDASRVKSVVALVADPSDGVANQAIRMLQFWGYPEDASASLVDRIGETDDAETLRRLLERLEGLDSAGAVSEPSRAELGSLLGHGDPEVRLRAATLMSRGGSSSAFDVLEDLLEEDDPEIRAQAALTLATAGRSPGRRKLRRILADSDLEVRRAALELVAVASPGLARDVLRDVATSSRAPDDLRTKALYLLQDIGEEEDVTRILTIGHTGSGFLRVQAVMVLGPLERRLGTRRSLEWMRDLLEKRDTELALWSAVLQTLREIGDPSFLDLVAVRLRECLNEQYCWHEDLSATISVLLGRRLHDDTFALRSGSP